MSYLHVPIEASTLPGSEVAEESIQKLLEDVASRKEFQFRGPLSYSSERWDGFIPESPASQLFLPGLRLNGAQLFIRNFDNPDTNFTRLLIKWQTGVGKSIAAISISQEFVRQYRARAAIGERSPTIFILSFTARENILEDMMKYPEFGFVSQTEVEELRRRRAAASAMGPASIEARQLSSFIGVLHRRITDRSRGGNFQFYGYKEFANHLIVVTRAGLERGFDVQVLYSRADGGTFLKELDDAFKRGDVLINKDLCAEMRGGFLFCDEIHNVYNILETNNYGIAIQYVLDLLGAEAPRTVFMSATPMTGSAAESVDLLNLLVPLSALPGGRPLNRSDFFIRTMTPKTDGDESSNFIVSQLREGALDKIAHLAAGRISFLLGSDVRSYPRRIFVGDEVADVPYLKMTLCPMTPYHERTLDREMRGSGGLAANAYTLYDMVFPNPEFEPDAAMNANDSYGLYKSGETTTSLSQASDEWRTQAGVIIEKGAEAGVSSGTYVITGSFLGLYA